MNLDRETRRAHALGEGLEMSEAGPWGKRELAVFLPEYP
jgi:hypothetical protein